jgi:hypothetical protein
MLPLQVQAAAIKTFSGNRFTSPSWFLQYPTKALEARVTGEIDGGLYLLWQGCRLPPS